MKYLALSRALAACAAGVLLFSSVAAAATDEIRSFAVYTLPDGARTAEGRSSAAGSEAAAGAPKLPTRTKADGPVPELTVPSAVSVLENEQSPINGISVRLSDGANTRVVVYVQTSAGSFYVEGWGSNPLVLGVRGTVEAVNGFLAAGKFLYLPEPDTTGTLTLTVGAYIDGDSSRRTTRTLPLTILPQNYPPVLTVPAALTVREDQPGVLSGISVADPDAGSGRLSMLLLAGRGTLSALSGGGVTVNGADSWRLQLDGTLADLNAFLANGVRYLTARDDAGHDALTISVSDNGNTGGKAKTDVRTLAVQVIGVNDPPAAAVVNPALRVNAGAGPQRITGWAAMTPGGGADEAGQTAASYLVKWLGGADASALFTAPPAVAADGSLTYAPAGITGSATFSLQVRDTGGTAHGGIDLSEPRSFEITILPADATLTLASNPAESIAGQTANVTATVTGQAPTGNVAFSANGQPIAGCAAVALSGSGNRRTATCAARLPLPGRYAIAARYEGDLNNNSANGSLTHTVLPTPSTVELILSPAAPRFGDAVAATANVFGGLAGGTVSFWLDGQALPDCQARSDASCRLPALAVGRHELRAVYSGWGTSGTSEGRAVLTVDRARPGLMLNAPAAAEEGQPIEVELVASGNPPPGGLVELRAADAGCVAQLSAGRGRCVLPVRAGSARITARYAGDANYAESTTETRLEQLKAWPHTGWWWAEAVPGRGYFFDVQHGQLLAAVLAFDLDGASRWYLAQGPLQSNGPGRWTFDAPLWRSAGGPELNGGSAPARFDQVVGTLSLSFDGPAQATQQSGGQPLALGRFPFNGNPATTPSGPVANPPEAGFWWNPAEPGRGFLLEARGEALMVAAAAYEPAATGGAPTWFLGAAPFVAGQAASGSWSRLGFGPTWRQPGTSPSLIGNAGQWRLQFSGERSGFFVLPDGRQLVVERFLFQ